MKPRAAWRAFLHVGILTGCGLSFLLCPAASAQTLTSSNYVVEGSLNYGSALPSSSNHEATGAVAAFGSAALGGDSFNAISEEAGAGLPVDPPAAVPAAEPELGVLSQTIAWTPSSSEEVEFYEIYRMADGEEDFEYLESVDADAPSQFEDEDVEFGKTYTYRIVVVDAGLNRSETDLEVSSVLYMPGDADKNNRIAISDLVPIFYANGSKKGDADYDSAIDGDRDGDIDVDDVALIALNYKATPSTFNASAVYNASKGRHAAYTENYRAMLAAAEGMEPSPDRDALIQKLNGWIEMGENGTSAVAWLDFQSGWTLIGLPFPISAGDLLEEFRLSGLRDVEIYDYADGAYRPVSDQPSLQLSPGTGYFIRSASPSKLTVERETTLFEESHSVSLKPGWNLLGNPFPEEAAIGMGGFAAGAKLFRLNGGRYETAEGTASIAPLQGFWLYAPDGGEIVFSR